jgi:hypothetical protein
MMFKWASQKNAYPIYVGSGDYVILDDTPKEAQRSHRIDSPEELRELWEALEPPTPEVWLWWRKQQKGRKS